MSTKLSILTFIFSMALFSCTEKVLEPTGSQADNLQTPTLKSATIYYVSKSGSDSNPGTSSAPFLTIQKAANVVSPGDIVLIGDGSYNSSGESVVTMTRGGNSTAYVTFKAQNKGKAILDGQSSTGYAILIQGGASYINIQDLEIRNFTWVGIHCNDSQISSYINIQGNKIHDIGRVSSSDDIGRCGIYLRMLNHHWVIERNLIYNIGRIGPDIWWNKDHAIYIGSADVTADDSHDNRISYNLIYGCSGAALQLSTNNSIVANNVIAWSNENSAGGSPFISVYPTTQNLTVANNIFYQPPTSNPYVFGSQYGSPGFIIKNNIVYGGHMWESDDSGTAAAMKGNNYGQSDCEKAQIDPKFVSAVRTNAPNVDFSLQSTSPAINIGANLGLTTDYFNNALVGVPDIGAIEYAGQTSTTTTYYNTQVATTVTKNNCGTGFTGSAVTYTVKAGTYSSTVSQADADSKAASDLSANAQTYANTNGTCTAQAIYYNTQVSKTATKNDCGTGYSGSTVTYTVAAKKYSSTISQADADAKATADLTANTQTYANTNGTCTATSVYYNTAMSVTAIKNDCGAGFTGTSVTYTVPAGKYSSTVSQADANSKASSDLNANAQTYANTNGTCTAVAVYYNTQMSATATKNDCGSGYEGTTVTYTVPAGKYSSTISLADANQKAQNDLSANKQTYANDNGTCSRIKWWKRTTKTSWWNR